MSAKFSFDDDVDADSDDSDSDDGVDLGDSVDISWGFSPLRTCKTTEACSMFAGLQKVRILLKTQLVALD